MVGAMGVCGVDVVFDDDDDEMFTVECDCSSNGAGCI